MILLEYNLNRTPLFTGDIAVNINSACIASSNRPIISDKSNMPSDSSGLILIFAIVFVSIIVAAFYLIKENKSVFRDIADVIVQVLASIALLPVIAIAFMGMCKFMIDMDEDIKNSSKVKKLFVWVACCWSIIGFFIILPLIGIFY